VHEPAQHLPANPNVLDQKKSEGGQPQPGRAPDIAKAVEQTLEISQKIEVLLDRSAA
jgi:hypothetical protein